MQNLIYLNKNFSVFPNCFSFFLSKNLQNDEWCVAIFRHNLLDEFPWNFHKFQIDLGEIFFQKRLVFCVGRKNICINFFTYAVALSRISQKICWRRIVNFKSESNDIKWIKLTPNPILSTRYDKQISNVIKNLIFLLNESSENIEIRYVCRVSGSSNSKYLAKKFSIPFFTSRSY